MEFAVLENTLLKSRKQKHQKGNCLRFPYVELDNENCAYLTYW